MKISKFILLLVLLITLACNKDDNFSPGNNCLRGQGTIVSETRTLSNFHSINNTIFADILLTQGPQEDVMIEAQQNILEEVKTEVINGELRITHNRCLDIVDPVILHVTIPEIENLTLTGVGDIIAQNEFDLADLKITLTGAGNFDLQGIATSLDIRLTGVGNVSAFDLNADVCNVSISGVGDVEVFVNDELNVTITGVGTVSYIGNPTITSNISGSGGIVNSN